MKKIKLIVLSVLAVMMLAGCSSASIKVSDANSVVMKIGSHKITKQDLFESMINSDGGLSVIDNAQNIILAAEIEDSNELNAAAQALVDETKEELGDSFLSTIQSAGYADEQAYFNANLALVKAEAIQKAYIEAHWDEVMKQYAPIKAKMMYFDGAEDTSAAYEAARAALTEVKAGTAFEDVAEANGLKAEDCAEKLVTIDQDMDYNLLQYVSTVTSPGLSDVISNKDVNGYYIVQVTATNVEQYKDEVIDYLTGDDDFTEDVWTDYFEKYNFTIYDTTLYNLLSENYSSYVVQD